MKQGSQCGSLAVLSEADLQRIHEAGLELLENPGVLCESDLILDILHKGGAQVDRNSSVIRIPPGMVELALESCPKSFVMQGLDPEMDLLVESGRVYYGMGGSSEPFFWDYETGRPRRPTKVDMVACTRVGQSLPNTDFIITLCQSGDMPTDQIFFHDTDAILRNTTKPIVFTVLDRRHATKTIGMLAAACGGESELRRRPLGMGFVTPVSPMVYPELIEGVVDTVDWGIPILSAPGPMMSGTGPATVAGLLAQTIAENLFGLVLVQTIKPGAPFVFKMDSDVMDPVTGQCTYGSPEQALGKAALAQMGRFYGVPTFTMGGGAEAKLPDSEAAAQAMMGMLINGLSGITLSQASGTMASGLYGSVEQLVICDEIAHMVKRVLGGFSVNDDTLALDVIRDVGHGGDFMTESHTLSHFRSELFFPVLFKRQTIEQWLSRGAKPMVDVAHARVEEILAQAGPVPLPVGADEALGRALREATA
ncbi:MAG: trimethylamine methyltransferase family protein [Ardenticatenia bacterium]|nr:trimethylamine methyltransferase family protein [Ardenticatenia bacterium]